MTTVTSKTVFDKKIDNIQHQLDIMRRESESFRAHANSHFEFVHNKVATKSDLYTLEQRLSGEMATKQDLHKMETGLRVDLASKDDLHTLTDIVTKIAEKVGVSL